MFPLPLPACRAHAAPRTSYRVGVVQPSGGDGSAGNTNSLAGLGALLGQEAARPAVMTVGNSSMPTPSAILLGGLHRASMDAAHRCEAAQGFTCKCWLACWPLQVSISTGNSSQQQGKGGKHVVDALHKVPGSKGKQRQMADCSSFTQFVKPACCADYKLCTSLMGLEAWGPPASHFCNSPYHSLTPALLQQMRATVRRSRLSGRLCHRVVAAWRS
jgi:hypothetical protein